MKTGFFDVVFECNAHRECEKCLYINEICNKFGSCFDNRTPSGVWKSVTNFEDLTEYVNKWREYNGETTK